MSEKTSAGKEGGTRLTDWEQQAVDALFPGLYEKHTGDPKLQKFIRNLVINTLVTHGFNLLTDEQRKEIAFAPDAQRIPYTLQHLTSLQLDKLRITAREIAPSVALVAKLNQDLVSSLF